jgi:hypothetical protein
MAGTRECAVCPATINLRACSRCKKAVYCSTEHAKLVSLRLRLPRGAAPLSPLRTPLTRSSIPIQLWLIYKRFCATGIESWFEDDVRPEELEKLGRLSKTRERFPLFEQPF